METEPYLKMLVDRTPEKNDKFIRRHTIMNEWLLRGDPVVLHQQFQVTGKLCGFLCWSFFHLTIKETMT